jgi:PBSX family phage terminase large subunit
MSLVKLDLGKPNPVQKQVFEGFRTGARFILMQGGRQVGKSHAGARFLVSEAANPSAKGKLNLAISPTFRMARVVNRKLQELFKSDKHLWDQIKYVSQPLPTYTFPDGTMIEVHSADDPDSLRGPTAHSVWFDEAAMASRQAYLVLLPTLLASNGKFLLTTTGRGKRNWVYEDMFLKGLREGHPEFDSKVSRSLYLTVLGTTMDNVENLSEDAIEELKAQYGEGSAFYRQEILGESVTYEGLVYRWDEERDYLAPQKLPDISECSLIAGGVDFGFSPDPFAVVVMGYKDGTWYVYDSVELERATVADMVSELSMLEKVWGVKDWIADSARPDTINELRMAGLSVRGVVKPEIMERVAEMSRFTDKGRFKVSWSAAPVATELGKYAFPEEDKKNQNPIDRYNHFMDASGYVIWTFRYIWRDSVKSKPAILEDEDDPYERFGKRRRKGKYGPAGLYSLTKR